MKDALTKLVANTSTSSPQHVMRYLTILAVQDCIIDGKYSKAGAGYIVEFEDIQKKLAEYAPTMLQPVKGTQNEYCYAQANAWTNSSKKPLNIRCTEYARAGPKDKESLEKDWVNVFRRSVVRNKVMDDVFTQNADSYYFDNDMRILLDTMRVVVRSYLVGKIAPKMMAMSANFLAEPGPVNANMASESTAAGVVWDAIGLGKSVSRGTLFAKNLYLQRQWGFPECVYCGNSITNQQIQMDHAMPIKHGGYSCHHAGNLFPSCRSCNQPGKNGKGAKYLGLDGWIRIKDFLGNNPKLVMEMKRSMTSIGSRRQIAWKDWWDEVIHFYSNHLVGLTVWNPGSRNSQLSAGDIVAIRQILENIKQK